MVTRRAPGLVCLILAFAFAVPVSAAAPKKSSKPAAKSAASGATLSAKSLLALHKAVDLQCTDVLDQPLADMPVITAGPDHVLDTEFRVRLFPKQLVPIYQQTKDGGWTCQKYPYDLREYGYFDPKKNDWVFGYPAPVLKISKGPDDKTNGDRLRVKLVNQINNPNANDQCHSGPKCSLACGTKDAPQCCTATDTFPECFHGDDITNLHFHGTHASPQPPQDYVLLDLYPEGSHPGAAHAAHEGGEVRVGSYQYDVDPVVPTQAEGTHWYHPHRHGATALQVGNGMAGALIIHGKFDDDMQRLYDNKLDEKLLVIQNIHGLNFAEPAPLSFSPIPLINGKPRPRIQMYPGQVQRWRMVSATMEASAQLRIDFNDYTNNAVVAKQIAMDGVQFAPENFERQPLMDGLKMTIDLSPGNRADFLVQAPVTPGIYSVRYELFGRVDEQLPENRQKPPNAKAIGNTVRERALEAVKAVAPESGGKPVLLTIEVLPCPAGDGRCNQRPLAKYPTKADWPKMPWYLDDIKEVDGTQKLLFSLAGKPATPSPQKFAIGINGGAPQQFNPSCVNFTEPLGRREEWTISQNQNKGSAAAPKPFHVFHIHTNPFQLRQWGTKKFNPPYVWMDSITLPNFIANDPENSKAVMRTKFEHFTGQYVLHCHFLGHEDRGMMLGVQTICPPGTGPWKYGKPKVSGDECVEGNTFPAAPACPVPNSSK